MRKAKIILCAALLALAGCAPCYADAMTGKTKVATQEWVRRTLAQSGIRVSAGTVSTNITVEGGVTVTNITTEGGVTVTNIATVGGTTVTNVVFTSPFSDTNFPGIVSITLTFATPAANSGVRGPALRGGNLLRSSVHQAQPISFTLKRGTLNAETGEGFLFAQGWELTWTDFPAAPSYEHVCQLDADCNCLEKDNTEAALREAMPEEYKTLTKEEAAEKWPDPSAFYPDWGAEDWQITRTFGQGANQRVVYYVNAYDPQGVREQPFRVADIGKTDAWKDSVEKLMLPAWNIQMQMWQLDYIDAHICMADNPQHDWSTKTCGTYSWSVCRNNSAHTQGTEQHSYPKVGASFTSTHHSCKCGTGPIEAHGTLIPDGEKTPTYNSDGKETGWTQTYVCPKGCGHYIVKTHTHRFENCGTCVAGDDCDTVCTGCDGEHVFGEATVTGVTEHDKCAKCECTMCSDCNAHPSYEDVTKHAGWEPCGEDVEEDNDDGTAKGGHCRCQCRAWGHNAAISHVNDSEHDYQRSDGMDVYEEIKDHTAPTRAATYHYEILGQCTRCKQWKKQLEEHDWPSDPTRYQYVSDSVCAYVYECKKCPRSKRDETHGHNLGSTIVYENVSASICRQKKQCQNKGCDAWINDDTHGHTRGEGCKCANGCGYQFDHSYVQDACGNSKCQYCGAYQYSQESHSGYKSGGTYSAAGHQCLCGAKPDVPHTFGSPVVLTRDGWNVTYRKTCTACGYYYDETKNENPCQSGHILNTQSDTCECMCGYYSPSNNVSTAQEMHNFADTENEDGVQTCTCKCGRFHVQRQWTTYRKNTEDAVGSKGACLNICAYCTDKEGTGLDIGPVDDSRHTPRTKGTCGCKCGKLTADGTNLEQFHIQKPGSCRCYGSDGNGGGWHFKCPKDGCTKICAYSSTSGLYSGADHHVASSAKEKAMPAKATPSDHTKTDAAACGCKCGTYTSANYSSWTQHANLHNSYPYHCGCYCGHASESQISPYHKKASDSQCKCQCGAKVVSHVKVPGDCKCQCRAEHYKQERQDGKCPGVCHGPCGEYADYSHKDKHTPKENGCGCECGQFGGSVYTGAGWHHGTGSPSCHCTCGYLHRFVASECPNVCATCGYDVSGARNDSGIHTYPSGQCACKCGRFKSHKFASNACECYCGDITRGHVWREKTRTFTEQYECQSCGETISVYHIVWECSRCGEEFDGTDEEDGHDPLCGDKPSEETLYPGGYCEKHNEYYDDACPKCMEEEEGGGGDGGGGSGGSTGGTGGYRDI